MFGFSLQKLLVLVVVVAAVWYGFKFITRLQDARRTDAELRDSAVRRTKAAKGPVEAEDMVQCPVCQAYIQARGVTDCGRADCPY